MMTREQAGIFEEIVAEREYQGRMAGPTATGWSTEFDDANTLNDWASYFAQYTARATKMGTPSAEQRKAVVKVAALAVAALEAFDRNGGFAPRHYDEPGTSR